MNGSVPITALVRQQTVIPHVDFPDLLNAHLKLHQGPKGTVALENRGDALRTGVPMNWSELESFIKDVCWWGDYAGISGRVLQRNSRTEITNNVNAAILQLRCNPPNLVGALSTMTEIKELGVSFASKHLRFLFPEYCPVLDSILSSRFFYELSPGGYGLFAAACTQIAGELNGAGVSCPFPGKPSWRPSDVEAALYAWISEWK